MILPDFGNHLLRCSCGGHNHLIKFQGIGFQREVITEFCPIGSTMASSMPKNVIFKVVPLWTFKEYFLDIQNLSEPIAEAKADGIAKNVACSQISHVQTDTQETDAKPK